MTKIRLPRFKCLRCGHTWSPHQGEVPRCCAFCKTPYWNVQPQRISRTWDRHAADCAACRGS